MGYFGILISDIKAYTILNITFNITYVYNKIDL